jgi:hypothetical protein
MEFTLEGLAAWRGYLICDTSCVACNRSPVPFILCVSIVSLDDERLSVVEIFLMLLCVI